VDRVEEDHRVDRVQRPVLPLGHPLDHLVGNRGDRLTGHVGAVHLGQMRGDLTGRQTLRRQRDHHVLNPGQSPLTLLHDLRLEAAVPVTGHADVNRTDLGQHHLAPHPVTGVTAVVAGRVTLVIPQVVGELTVQRRFQDPFGQLLQQTACTGQLQPRRAGLFHQLVDELGVDPVIRPRRSTLRHPASIGPSGQQFRHRCSP
jgi:hypothetical protein